MDAGRRDPGRRDQAGRRGRRGGQQFRFTDTGALAVVGGARTLTPLRDNTRGGSTGEASLGAVARVRLYSSALTASQVQGLERTPG